MAQAMHTRMRSAVRNGQAELRNQFLKRVTDRGGMDRFGLAEREQWGHRRERSAPVLQQVEIFHDEPAHPWAEGHQAALPEFCLAHDQQLTLEVEIVDAQSGDFSDTHAQAV